MCGEEIHALYPSDATLEQDLGFCRGIRFLVESLFDDSASVASQPQGDASLLFAWHCGLLSHFQNEWAHYNII